MLLCLSQKMETKVVPKAELLYPTFRQSFLITSTPRFTPVVDLTLDSSPESKSSHRQWPRHWEVNSPDSGYLEADETPPSRPEPPPRKRQRLLMQGHSIADETPCDSTRPGDLSILFEKVHPD